VAELLPLAATGALPEAYVPLAEYDQSTWSWLSRCAVPELNSQAPSTSATP
jgi:hypothetical protein